MTEQNKMAWTDLHDALLGAISISWEAGEIEISLTANKVYVKRGGKIIIRAKGFSLFVCPHNYPWGRSAFVNAIREHVITEPDRKRLEIEMQSGDVIELEADEVLLQDK